VEVIIRADGTEVELPPDTYKHWRLREMPAHKRCYYPPTETTKNIKHAQHGMVPEDTSHMYKDDITKYSRRMCVRELRHKKKEDIQRSLQAELEEQMWEDYEWEKMKEECKEWEEEGKRLYWEMFDNMIDASDMEEQDRREEEERNKK
jgi:hypothetical protein